MFLLDPFSLIILIVVLIVTENIMSTALYNTVEQITGKKEKKDGCGENKCMGDKRRNEEQQKNTAVTVYYFCWFRNVSLKRRCFK